MFRDDRTRECGRVRGSREKHTQRQPSCRDRSIVQFDCFFFRGNAEVISLPRARVRWNLFLLRRGNGTFRAIHRADTQRKGNNNFAISDGSRGIGGSLERIVKLWQLETSGTLPATGSAVIRGLEGGGGSFKIWNWSFILRRKFREATYEVLSRRGRRKRGKTMFRSQSDLA